MPDIDGELFDIVLSCRVQIQNGEREGIARGSRVGIVLRIRCTLKGASDC